MLRRANSQNFHTKDFQCAALSYILQYPHLKIRPIAIFAFYSLNYSLAACLQDNYRPKSPTKVETKRKLQQFTASGWFIMNGGGVVASEKYHSV